MTPPQKSAQQEHPFVNILINVLIPVLALSHLSKDPAFQEVAKPWHIGPVKGLMVALAFPLCYGIWNFIQTRKANFFSALGLCSVLLTGGLTIYLWNQDGTIKPNADILFGLKEASIPLLLGIAVIGSHYTANPLLRTFLYSDSIFDIPRIEQRVGEIDGHERYRSILLRATWLFATSFFISTLMNFGLALYFLGGLDHAAVNARELYNEQVAKLTGMGFLVIGVPIMIFMLTTIYRLMKDLRELTGLTNEQLTHPR